MLVSDTTYEATRESFEWAKSFRAEVKGKAQAVVVYPPSFGVPPKPEE